MAFQDWSPRDLYGELGVSPTASTAEIKRAFRRIAQEDHPDVNPSQEAKARYNAASEAVAHLTNPAERTAYDEYRAASGAPQSQTWQPTSKESGVHDEEPPDSSFVDRVHSAANPTLRQRPERQPRPTESLPDFTTYRPRELSREQLKSMVSKIGNELYRKYPSLARELAPQIVRSDDKFFAAAETFINFKRGDFNMDQYLSKTFNTEGKHWKPALAYAVMSEMCAAGAMARVPEDYAKGLFTRKPDPWLNRARSTVDQLVKDAGLAPPHRARGL